MSEIRPNSEAKPTPADLIRDKVKQHFGTVGFNSKPGEYRNGDLDILVVILRDDVVLIDASRGSAPIAMYRKEARRRKEVYILTDRDDNKDLFEASLENNNGSLSVEYRLQGRVVSEGEPLNRVKRGLGIVDS